MRKKKEKRKEGFYREENIFQRREVIKSFSVGERRGKRRKQGSHDKFSFIENSSNE